MLLPRYLLEYRRVSTKDQLTGTGMDMQELSASLRKELCEQYDLVPYGQLFDDAGVSAFKHEAMERPAFKQMMDVADESASDSIVVLYNWDRLSRQDIHQAMTTLMQITSRVRLYIMSERRIFSKNDPDLMVSLMMALIGLARAGDESKAKSARTTNAALQRINEFDQGIMGLSGTPRWVGVGRTPAWITLDANKCVQPNNKFIQVRRIVELTLLGYVTVAVTKAVNKEFDTNWKSTVITELLQGVALIGTLKIELNGQTHTLENYFPAVCTEAEFYRLRHKKVTSQSRRGGQQALPLLTGHSLVKHHQCGGGIRASYSGKRVMAYSCLCHATGGECAGNGFNLIAQTIETAIFDVVSDALFNAQPAKDSPIPHMELQLGTLQTELSEYTEIANTGRLPKSLIGRMLVLESDISKLTADIQKERGVLHIDALAEEWRQVNRDILQSVTFSEDRMRLRDLLTHAVNSITIDKVKGSKAFTLCIVMKTGEYRYYQTDGKGRVDMTTSAADKLAIVHNLLNV